MRQIDVSHVYICAVETHVAPAITATVQRFQFFFFIFVTSHLASPVEYSATTQQTEGAGSRRCDLTSDLASGTALCAVLSLAQAVLKMMIITATVHP